MAAAAATGTFPASNTTGTMKPGWHTVGNQQLINTPHTRETMEKQDCCSYFNEQAAASSEVNILDTGFKNIQVNN